MKAIFSCAAAFLTLATVTSADAKGCLKGAVVGGTAGHFASARGSPRLDESDCRCIRARFSAS
jgi:hypothetical protein